ncbi:anchored repeat-type ABC transporter, ATP-binding subunit [Corynebacterium mustelae]|uniref:Anchored repeat-type ABC transporter, ATP-binding subunit n=1 Tax=Corynebacterium mustelae TaxID=571915 RepID=A0A0G3H0Q8_9CORY|nr:anchored repeat-type ABC transporter ATP-binding subunit [Corynebacterium mustelae]AKK05408.1 anchored repeat-type ABC transporter, ATP-binding subunit [Corynebacterium mustelae]
MTIDVQSQPQSQQQPRTALLTATDVSVTLSGRRIFDSLSFSMSAGEFVGLVGPNGAGKTTFLRAILGLVPTSSGVVEVAGNKGRKLRSAVGYVPQRHEFAWDFPISIRECVANGRTGVLGWVRRPGRSDYDAVDEAIARVGLESLAYRPIGQLSGGQRQRVLVARALSTKPQVLLFDEPFTGLDMPTAEQLTRLFSDLADAGTAIIMSTHDIGEALHSCHRLVLFKNGIRADGSPSELTDKTLWCDTFEVGENSPLITLVRAHTHA